MGELSLLPIYSYCAHKRGFRGHLHEEKMISGDPIGGIKKNLKEWRVIVKIQHFSPAVILPCVWNLLEQAT